MATKAQVEAKILQIRNETEYHQNTTERVADAFQFVYNFDGFHKAVAPNDPLAGHLLALDHTAIDPSTLGGNTSLPENLATNDLGETIGTSYTKDQANNNFIPFDGWTADGKILHNRLPNLNLDRFIQNIQSVLDTGAIWNQNESTVRDSNDYISFKDGIIRQHVTSTQDDDYTELDSDGNRIKLAIKGANSYEEFIYMLPEMIWFRSANYIFDSLEAFNDATKVAVFSEDRALGYIEIAALIPTVDSTVFNLEFRGEGTTANPIALAPPKTETGTEIHFKYEADFGLENPITSAFTLNLTNAKRGVIQHIYINLNQLPDISELNWLNDSNQFFVAGVDFRVELMFRKAGIVDANLVKL